MKAAVLVVFLLSGAAVVTGGSGERDDSYPSLVSPDGIEFFDFDRSSPNYERTFRLELPTGITFEDAIEPCRREGESEESRRLLSCVADYIVEPCWASPAQEDGPETKLIYSAAEDPAPEPDVRICLE